MNVYNLVSTVIAFVLYAPLAKAILRGEVKQNLATFCLWALLDVVVTASIVIQGGNWYLPAAYTIGSGMVIYALIKMGQYEWTWFETLISILVLICIVGWYESGSRMATILSTTGVVLAGLPMIKDSYYEPFKQPLGTYVWFVLANGLSTIGGKAWTIEERFYPASCTVLCLVTVLVIWGRRQQSAKD